MKDGDIQVVNTSNKKTVKKVNIKIVGAIIGVLVLILGVVAGILLVKQQQNISEKAAPSCVEQCPASDGKLYNCHPPETDGTASVSICNSKGRVEFCGSRNYCCPSAGGVWTTNMTACTATSTPSPIASATATTRATATSSSTTRSTATSTSRSTSTTRSTATSTSRSTSTSRATSAPLPVTGVEWPTILGTGFGIIMILASLALAL